LQEVETSELARTALGGEVFFFFFLVFCGFVGFYKLNFGNPNKREREKTRRSRIAGGGKKTNWGERGEGEGREEWIGARNSKEPSKKISGENCSASLRSGGGELREKSRTETKPVQATAHSSERGTRK